MLAIVPARGGSKTVKRKNLRPVNGRPLLLHTLDMLGSLYELDRVIVSTDDPEIASVAHNHGHEVLDRPAECATDSSTVADVAVHAVGTLGWDGPVGVFQPTSPTLQAQTVRNAIREFDRGGYLSLCSVVADTKLRWDAFGPLWAHRVNRQELDPEWCETGGIQLARSVPVSESDPLIGRPHCIFPVPADEAHDIDTPDDLEAVRRALGRKRIEIRLVASRRLGAGHLYRCLALADELSHHEILFAVHEPWAQAIITGRGYRIGTFDTPHLVVFDCLDTTEADVAACKTRGAKVVTLEDLGPGSRLADLVVNELYADTRPNVECGPRWAVLRPEFLGLPLPEVQTPARRVLVMFGGTDPSHLSERVSRVCARESDVTVLCGPAAGPGKFDPNISVLHGASVSLLMRSHDLLVTSAGRTVHEAAACGIPVLSIAANERESRHSHCPGVVRLPVHVAVSNDQIQEAVYRLLHAPDLRAEMAATARAAVDGLGTARIVHRIQGLLEGL